VIVCVAFAHAVGAALKLLEEANVLPGTILSIVCVGAEDEEARRPARKPE